MNLGKLVLGTIRGFFQDVLIQKAQELVMTAANTNLTGEQKRQQVLKKLRATPGEIGKQLKTMPNYLVHILEFLQRNLQ